MADETKKDETKNDLLKKPAAPVLVDTSLRSRVVDAGKAPNSLLEPAPLAPHLAGEYEIVHGSVNLGYEAGKPVYIHKGGRVNLTAEEATGLMPSKSIRKVA